MRRRLLIETILSTPLLAKIVGILETNVNSDECKLFHERIRKLKLFEVSAGCLAYFSGFDHVLLFWGEFMKM